MTATATRMRSLVCSPLLPCIARSSLLRSFVRFYERPAKAAPPIRSREHFERVKEAERRAEAERLQRCAANVPLVIEHAPFVNAHFEHVQQLERATRSNQGNQAVEADADAEADATPDAALDSPASSQPSTDPLVFAVFSDRGAQFKAVVDDVVMVDRMNAPVGAVLTFDRVLLLGSQSLSLIGRPFLAGATVECVVESHEQTAKVLVFHKKRRKHQQKLQGHRSQVTTLRVTNITAPPQFHQQLLQSLPLMHARTNEASAAPSLSHS